MAQLQFKVKRWTEQLYQETSTYRPRSEQINQEIPTEACGEHLGDDVQVGDQGRLQDDGNVGGVEELDGVGVVLTTVASWLDGQIHPESLGANEREEDDLWNVSSPLCRIVCITVYGSR